MRRSPRLRALGRLSVGTGIVLVPLVVGMYLVFVPGSPFEPWGLGGLAERLVFVVLLGWYVLAAAALGRRAPSGEPRGRSAAAGRTTTSGDVVRPATRRR
jgi:hypothetical protein